MYGHGSAILNTLQQLAGAAGTAALIGALALGASLSGLADPAAQVAGAKLAFAVGGSIIVDRASSARRSSRGTRAKRAGEASGGGRPAGLVKPVRPAEGLSRVWNASTPRTASVKRSRSTVAPSRRMPSCVTLKNPLGRDEVSHGPASPMRRFRSK